MQRLAENLFTASHGKGARCVAGLPAWQITEVNSTGNRMLKRKIRNLAVLAIAIASATGLTALYATSASAETLGPSVFVVNSGYTPLHLTANGVGQRCHDQ